MTVKEIFELRRQGRIEEAYEAIRPMYAVHKGHYTSLCMFWTASDILKKHLKEGRTDEALKIFKALVRMLPNVDDSSGMVHATVIDLALRLGEATTAFSLLDFTNLLKLTERDFQPTTSKEGFTFAPLATRMLTQVFTALQKQPTVDNALQAMPLLEAAAKHAPNDPESLRLKDAIRKIIDDSQAPQP